MGSISAERPPDQTGPRPESVRLLREPSGNLTVIIRETQPLPPMGASRVFVPYTKVLREVVLNAPAGATWVDVSSGPYAYWGLLLRLWAASETFTIVEHDVICRPDVIDGFESCREPWCLHAYDPFCSCPNPDCREAGRNNLGCVRFRRELIEAAPNAVSSIPVELRLFSRLCDGLAANLRDADFTHHWHEPGVEHVKESP